MKSLVEVIALAKSKGYEITAKERIEKDGTRRIRITQIKNPQGVATNYKSNSSEGNMAIRAFVGEKMTRKALSQRRKASKKAVKKTRKPKIDKKTTTALANYKKELRRLKETIMSSDSNRAISQVEQDLKLTERKVQELSRENAKSAKKLLQEKLDYISGFAYSHFQALQSLAQIAEELGLARTADVLRNNGKSYSKRDAFYHNVFMLVREEIYAMKNDRRMYENGDESSKLASENDKRISEIAKRGWTTRAMI